MPKKARKSSKPASKPKKKMQKKKMSPQDFMKKFLQEKQEMLMKKQQLNGNSHIAPVVQFNKPHQEMRFSKFAGPRRKAS